MNLRSYLNLSLVSKTNHFYRIDKQFARPEATNAFIFGTYQMFGNNSIFRTFLPYLNTEVKCTKKVNFRFERISNPLSPFSYASFLVTLVSSCRLVCQICRFRSHWSLNVVWQCDCLVKFMNRTIEIRSGCSSDYKHKDKNPTNHKLNCPLDIDLNINHGL